MIHIAIVEPIHPNAIKIIEDNKNYSYEVIENVEENNLINKLKECDAIALRTASLTSKIINNCNKLKIVSRHGVGYDNVDVNALNNKDIPLTITIHANAITVAEHVIAMMFYLNKKLHLFDDSVRNNNYDKLRIINNNIITVNSELYKKNILIIGFGRIGKELSKRCQAFEMQILVFDPYIDDNTVVKHRAKKIDNLEEGISIADYISIHMPLNKETKNIINKDNLKKMKKESFIINTARGGIINEHDLSEALDNNIIAGAGIDVYSQEPPKPDNPLLNNSKVVLTPHTAALTKECWLRMGQETINNIINFFDNVLDQKVVVNTSSIKNKKYE